MAEPLSESRLQAIRERTAKLEAAIEAVTGVLDVSPDDSAQRAVDDLNDLLAEVHRLDETLKACQARICSDICGKTHCKECIHALACFRD